MLTEIFTPPEMPTEINHVDSTNQQKIGSYIFTSQFESIHEVIDELDKISKICVKNDSPIGYFTALYTIVTKKVRDAIAVVPTEKNADQLFFQNPERMEVLDIIFAKRYIDAFYVWASDKGWLKEVNPKPLLVEGALTKCWKVAFDSSDSQKLLIIQHILLGINAHINLDLGVSTVQTVHADTRIKDTPFILESIYKDYDTINVLLGSLVKLVEEKIASRSILMSLIALFGKGNQDKLAMFSIDVARTGAWYYANQLHFELNEAKADEEEKVFDANIGKRDDSIEKIATGLGDQKNLLVRKILSLTCKMESDDVVKNIEAINNIEKLD